MIRCYSPVDGCLYAERPLESEAGIRAALDLARAGQAEWASASVAERGVVCLRIVEEMLAMTSEIVPELAWQMGRPVRYGAGELRGFEERARYMIGVAEEALQPFVPEAKDGFTRYVRRAPLGIVLVIAPWNYPYLTAVNSVIPALMAGNAVLLKHASQTLLVGERFQMACDRAGVPAGVFRNLCLSHDQAGSLLSDGLVDQVNFTGSVGAGRVIEQAAAGSFIGAGLELGGKDPAYVRHDANLEHAIENLVDGAFFNSGQSCCGIERIYVHADRYDAFVEGVVHLASEYVLGDPLEQETTLGPMVSANAAGFVRGQITAAVAAGAKALVPAASFRADKTDSPYMAPQVLVGVDHSMAVMTEESFGPVVGIMPVSGDNEAVRLMNDSPFGLTASIWSADAEAAVAVGDRVQTGTVFMNRCDYLDPALAWTGVKNTGRGCTLSRFGYDSLTRPKSYHLKTQI
ncbi:MAG: acyl-CoA reductase-like NAD-dependent aldehyde dehydrogenase [Rhodothermales bacterium]|jgi:acyl-CoA reductase-like NAD-dependent aldehyde dehydrogenase